ALVQPSEAQATRPRPRRYRTGLRLGQAPYGILQLTSGNLARAPAPVGETRQPDRRHAPTLSADVSTRSPDLGSASACPECQGLGFAARPRTRCYARGGGV